MPLDNRIGTKVQKNLRREESTATRVEPYPYIGIVKNNLDPTRSGRLQVYIPDLGGEQDNQSNWRTVSYASPFMGYTTNKFKETDKPSSQEQYDSVAHTYGMWMVPPDLGVEVIVIFVAGDPQRGYWIACVNSNLSHYMVPGLAGSKEVDLSLADADTKKSFLGGNPMPVVEFNEYNPANSNSEFYKNAKPVHQEQFNILRQQGLDRDPVRGAVSSSSQRETPSTVFGISTPGRPTKDPAENVDEYLAQARAGKLTEEYYKVRSRKGGHTFIMDDGSVLGEDRLVRLRSARGHQVMMHDSMNTLYIAHADGDSWIEMTREGAIKMYTKGGFALRSEGSINLHTDGSLNLNAGGSINMKAGGKIKLESSGTSLLTGKLSIESTSTTEFKVGSNFNVEATASIGLTASAKIIENAASILQNTDPSPPVNSVDPLKTYQLPDSVYNRDIGVWVNKTKAMDTIVTVAPTHEPYYRGEVQLNIPSEAPETAPQATYTGSYDAVKNAKGSGITNPAGDKQLRDQPAAKTTVGNLSKDEMTALMAQIGKSESGGDYTKENTIGFIGKYQFGYQALIDRGLVKSTVTSNAQLNNPNSWIPDKCASKNEFLNNPALQEETMEAQLKANYSSMVSRGAITADMPTEEVGGMLSVAHLLGAGGANTWRKGGGGSDAYGTTGDSYFQRGKFAVAVLAPKMPDINAG